jgi:hypothetical protein
MIFFVATLSAIAAFGLLSYRLLQSAAYTSTLSAICALLVMAQMSVSAITATAPALLLALTVYLIAAGGVAFARLQNVRNVVLLSGALALVQGVNPIGTVMAATLVPVLIGLQSAEMIRARRMSLLVLLLFVPVSAALFLAYLTRTVHWLPSAWLIADVAQVEAGNAQLSPNFWIEGALRAAELALIALPVWITAALVRTRASITIATVCAALIVAVTVSIFLGRLRPIALVAPALALLAILALREWPREQSNPRLVVAGPALSVFLTWLFAALAA